MRQHVQKALDLLESVPTKQPGESRSATIAQAGVEALLAIEMQLFAIADELKRIQR